MILILSLKLRHLIILLRTMHSSNKTFIIQMEMEIMYQKDDLKRLIMLKKFKKEILTPTQIIRNGRII